MSMRPDDHRRKWDKKEYERKVSLNRKLDKSYLSIKSIILGLGPDTENQER